MSVRDIIGRDKIDDLWGEGYTIVKRQADPFFFDPRNIPTGMAYQWCPKENLRDWQPIIASRYDGIYAPVGYEGPIEYDGLVLCEKLFVTVAGSLAGNSAAAAKNVSDWVERTGGEFTGAVKVGTSEDDAKTTQIGDALSTVNETKIPKELVPYILEILRERDRMAKQYCPEGNPAPGVKAAALLNAIDTIRELHKDELNANPA